MSQTLHEPRRSKANGERFIVTNSTMWQSPQWNLAIVNVLSAEEEHWRAPHPPPLATAWRLWQRRKEGSVVAPMGGGAAFLYCLIARLVGCTKPAQVVHEFFLPEPAPKSILWLLKRQLRRYAFARAKAIVVYAEGERQLCAEYLKLPLSCFHVVPFHTNIVAPHFESEAAYGFAAGRSGRDYRTFFAAVRGLDYPFVVVSDRASVSGLDVPRNVELHCDIPRDEYLSLLKKAAFVVVPLHPWHRSTGQVVILEGYAFGKPAVVSRVVGTVDYVKHGETGYFCEPYDSGNMNAVIQRMIADDAERQRLGHKALELVNTDYLFPVHVENLLKVMRKAAEAS